MILELTVENIAIIDRAQVAFGPGFTALTGETGAGKSLVIDAIGLALGERADSDLVRAGAVKGTVVMSVDLSDCPAAAARCADLGVELDEGVLFVQREVLAEGRSTVRLNGRTAPVGILKEVGSLLVDLHGQHDHQALLHPERQIDFLDLWIGPECADYKSELAAQFAIAEAVKRRLNALRQSRRDREQRLDMLRFQVEEINAVDPLPGELDELENQLRRLQNIERLSQAGLGALESLQEKEGSALESVSLGLRDLENVVAFDPALEEVLEPLRSASAYLEEGCRSLRAYLENLEIDNESIEVTAGRIEDLRKLRRKYGDSEEAVLEFLARAEEELTLLEDSTASEDSLSAELEVQDAELRRLADRLTALRNTKALEFAKSALSHIRDLGMEKAEFEAQLKRRAVDATGQDDLELVFSANAGEPLMPLNRVASGGELSRVMLAIKAASAGRAGVPTLIFDEVDTGLSGRAAATMAKKLEELSAHRQVIVISHLPQIAGRAAAHYRIEKVEEGSRSVTRIVALSGEERVEEIARMLAGEKVGASALANARELLA